MRKRLMEQTANLTTTDFWKPIKGFEGLYDLRSDGLLYSHPRGTTKGGYTYGYTVGIGYLGTVLSNKKIRKPKRMHRLVWETFVGEIPKGYDVHHKNHIRTDNRLENLELIEDGEHSKMHYEENKENLDNIRIKKRSMKVLQYTLDGEFIAEYPSTSVAAKINNINSGGISNCCNGIQKSAYGYIWKYKEVA